MPTQSNVLRNLTLALSMFIVTALALASMAGLVEVPLLALFWYLALAGMALMILMTATLTVAWVWNRWMDRYRHLIHHWGDGVPGH